MIDAGNRRGGGSRWPQHQPGGRSIRKDQADHNEWWPPIGTEIDVATIRARTRTRSHQLHIDSLARFVFMRIDGRFVGMVAVQVAAV